MSNCLLFARGSSPQSIWVLMDGLTPSSYTGLCLSLSWSTFTFVDPSSFRHMHVSTKAGVLFCSTSTVNLMLSSIEIRCCVYCSTALSCSTGNVSSTYLNQVYGRLRCFSDRSSFKVFHVQIRHYWVLRCVQFSLASPFHVVGKPWLDAAIGYTRMVQGYIRWIAALSVCLCDGKDPLLHSRQLLALCVEFWVIKPVLLVIMGIAFADMTVFADGGVCSWRACLWWVYCHTY